MKKTMDQAYEILEDAATNTNQWPRDKITLVKAIGDTDNEVRNNLVTHVARLTDSCHGRVSGINKICIS